MRRSAIGAVASQSSQALSSFLLQLLVARALGLEGLGTFAILYGVIVLASGIISGFVGDSLVVLDRGERTVRSALQQYAVALSVASGTISGLVLLTVGLISSTEAVLFAVATVAFCIEEVLRRLLGAGLTYWRVTLVDTIGFIATMVVVLAMSMNGPLTLSVFLLAIAVGQITATIAAIPLLPSHERRLVGLVPGAYRVVAEYGLWRSLQQLLRPGMLTAVRALVTAFAGLAATGLLEVGRIYVAPALLIVNGLSSFMFVSFASDRERPARELVRRADRAVFAMLAGTAAVTVVALATLPVLGPLLFGTGPDPRAVAGWLVYSASVAAVTPWGALASISGRQRLVFTVRLGDTLLGVAGVSIVLATGASVPVVPLVLAGASVVGGLVIRFLILLPLVGKDGAARAA